MQHLTQQFQDYILRLSGSPQQTAGDSLIIADTADRDDEQNGGKGGGREGIKIVIDWGALDIDRPPQTIRRANDTDTIVELLRLLLDAFKKSMRDQLTELPIVRFPLSMNPQTDFLNRSQNRPYSYTQIPGTDLYFCPHSQRSQKVERLKALFSRLILPDGSEFPEGCVTVTVENDE